jgi:hypothetical protein
MATVAHRKVSHYMEHVIDVVNNPVIPDSETKTFNSSEANRLGRMRIDR